MRPGDPELRIFEDVEELARAAAEEFQGRASSKRGGDDRFTVALSGGSTPRRLHGLLASEPYRDRIPWKRVHLFWGDKRAVPPDHPDSNFGAARKTLLTEVPIPTGNVHRIKAELSDAAAAAEDYERELRRFFDLSEDEFPRFDLILLGMGADGHTASLFPRSKALEETRRLVVAPWVEKLEAHRVTLTLPVLNRAACVIFLVAGVAKAEALSRILAGGQGPSDRPAGLVQPESGELLWFIDRALGSLLQS
ncbi:MAG: 6-phosphogluconolactonase [Gemmatimonadota bacterium]